jgi:hypothetical protein
VYPADYRSDFAEPLFDYQTAIDKIDRAWAAYGATSSFFDKAVHIYADAIAFRWPPGMARVRFTDNWILASASFLDPVVLLIGLKKDADLFSQFESYRYERALGRGFGICSQNALGFADLLDRRYGIDVHVVGLGGHVVTQVNLPHQQVLLDPSVGVYLPFGLNIAEKFPSALIRAYKQAGYEDTAKTYDSADNFISPSSGAWGYSEHEYRKQAFVRYFERAADLMKWVIPLAVLLMLAFWSSAITETGVRWRQLKGIPADSGSI